MKNEKDPYGSFKADAQRLAALISRDIKDVAIVLINTAARMLFYFAVIYTSQF
jgi:hypothetical protein